ncbi:hypothetical protein DSM107003_42700 [Trichormus variabilis SAG 1403-4b]|uniref:Uncharacterized protein n=1 Tax=Trichormus variabilis SAG 1403-4b TaxID=447716 RepID=A0A3S1AJV7_ANAVA|nr:hypothetical protein DSM107003_42700 [Trichormus variabilis SAG 1403-4b]
MGIAERTGIIWVPEDDIDLLAVGLDEDYDDSDVQSMININQAGRDWLDNKISLSDYCDILEANNIPDPFELVGEFCEHTELIMRAGL